MCCCGCIEVVEEVIDNCNLENLFGSIIHCNGSEYIVFVNVQGDMSYKNYYYLYEYTQDNGQTWQVIPSSGNTYFQFLEAIEYSPSLFYPVRITVKCSISETETRIYYSEDINSDNTFSRFLQVKVNGVLQDLISSSAGINYFCPNDTLEFVMFNTDYSIDVTGPTSWSTGYELFVPGTLTSGEYIVDLSNIVEPDLSVCPPGGVTYEMQMLTLPYIDGDTEVCFGASTALNADHGEGYDSYIWSTGETSPSIVVSSAGFYSVTVTHPDYPGCTVTSHPAIVTIKDPLPDLEVVSWDSPICISFSSTVDPTSGLTLNVFTGTVGNVFNFYVTPGYDLYDFGFGPGVDNFYDVSGPGVITVVATLNGCTSTIDVSVVLSDSDIVGTITQTNDATCTFDIDFSGTNSSFYLLNGTTTMHVYETLSGSPVAGPTDYPNQDTATYTMTSGGDGLIVIGDSYADVNGCFHTIFQSATCV